MASNCTYGVCAFGRQCVTGTGPIPAPVMLIGEAPGKKELELGRPFVGPSGALLDTLLLDAGLARADLRITNTTGCVDMQREDRRPQPAELDACRSRLQDEIAATDPIAIVLMGNTALDLYFPGMRIGQVYGQWRVVSARRPIVVLPTYHPAHVLRGAHQVRPVILEAFKSARRLARG